MEKTEQIGFQGHDLETNVSTSTKYATADLGYGAAPLEAHGFYARVGNPVLAGLCAHASTLMLLATQFMHWDGVSSPAAYIGNLYFVAGLYMFASFNWCLVKGETFAATVFSVFGGFYLSYAAILTPAFNVAATYDGKTSATSTLTEYASLSTFLWIWSGLFFLIFVASLRTNLAFVIVFFGVIIGVWLLAGMYGALAAEASSAKVLALSQAGGAFLFLSACSGFYLCAAMFFESTEMPFALPLGELASYWPKKRVNHGPHQ